MGESGDGHVSVGNIEKDENTRTGNRGTEAQRRCNAPRCGP